MIYKEYWKDSEQKWIATAYKTKENIKYPVDDEYITYNHRTPKAAKAKVDRFVAAMGWPDTEWTEL